MTVNLTAESTDAEFAAFIGRAGRAQRNDLVQLAYGVRFARDANTMKDPIAIADRLDLAYAAFIQASVFAKSIKDRLGTDEPLAYAIGIAKNFYPQYIEFTTNCFNAFHDDRKEKLAKFKSGPQQLKSARASLKKLERLRGRYKNQVLIDRFAFIWEYWTDQVALLSQYDAPDQQG